MYSTHTFISGVAIRRWWRIFRRNDRQKSRHRRRRPLMCRTSDKQCWPATSGGRTHDVLYWNPVFLFLLRRPTAENSSYCGGHRPHGWAPRSWVRPPDFHRASSKFCPVRRRPAVSRDAIVLITMARSTGSVELDRDNRGHRPVRSIDDGRTNCGLVGRSDVGDNWPFERQPGNLRRTSSAPPPRGQDTQRLASVVTSCTHAQSATVTTTSGLLVGDSSAYNV